MNKNLSDLIDRTANNRTELIHELENTLAPHKFSTNVINEILAAHSKNELANIIDNEYSRIFFEHIWQHPGTLEEQEQIEREILDLVIEYNVKTVLDIGCGFNTLKLKLQGHVTSFTGIDPYNPAADLQVTLRDFLLFSSYPRHYDLIIAHGSLHFGTKEEVSDAISCATSLLKTNPGGIISVRFNLGKLPKSAPYLNVSERTKEEIMSMFTTEDNGIRVLPSHPVKILNDHRLVFTGIRKKSQ